MSFRKYLIETHLKMVDYRVVPNQDGSFSVHFTMKNGSDKEIRKHSAAHAAMHMNQMLHGQSFDSVEQAQQAAAAALDTQRGGGEGDYHDDMKEEAPTNSVGGGENIAGINPPAGPGPLTKRDLQGVAAGKTPQDIAKHHKVPLVKIIKQLEKGVKVEQEHTDNAETALTIAMDHVYEDPSYYSKLARMEKKESYDIGNDTTFNKKGDRLAKYRVAMLQTRRTTGNEKPEERI
jgi:hypothetical protein